VELLFQILMSNTDSKSSSPIRGVPKPSDNEFRCQIEEINQKVAEVQIQLEAIQGELMRVQDGSGSPNIEGKTQLRNELNSVQDQLDMLENTRKVRQEKLSDLQRTAQSLTNRSQMMGRQLEFDNLDSVKKRVMELNNTLQRSNLSLQDEKETIKEISKLKMKIPTIKAGIKEKESVELERREALSKIDGAIIEVDEVRVEIEKARRVRKEYQDKMRVMNEADAIDRKSRGQKMDDLVQRREELTELRDSYMTELLDAQTIFNDALKEYRKYEAEKRKLNEEKTRERKRIERNRLEREEILKQLADCVVDDDDQDDEGQRVMQLYTYCQNELDNFQADSSPKKKKVDITLLSEFGGYGLDIPATKEDYENAMQVLEPLYYEHDSATQKVMDAVNSRRSALEAKLKAFDARVMMEGGEAQKTI